METRWRECIKLISWGAKLIKKETNSNKYKKIETDK